MIMTMTDNEDYENKDDNHNDTYGDDGLSMLISMFMPVIWMIDVFPSQKNKGNSDVFELNDICFPLLTQLIRRETHYESLFRVQSGGMASTRRSPAS